VTRPAATGFAAAGQLAPNGTLRVAVWALFYFAVADASGKLAGIIPDLADELARRLGVPVGLVPFAEPGAIVTAFRAGAVDVTFLGITADRAEAMTFGPPVIGLQSSFLVPDGSALAEIADLDRPGVRIAVPQRSAQEAHLRNAFPAATLVGVPPQAPEQAVALLAAGDADAFCHVVPMLAAVEPRLPGGCILPGSTFTVPVAIACANDRPAAAAYCRSFVAAVTADGFVARAIERAGMPGLVVYGAAAI
jgi:polar amino acid transport system substrate-binding protein